MVTTIKPKSINHKDLQRALQANHAAYIESVGKHNKQDTADIINHPTGAGTVLRLFFGATTEMPLRGLSYITAAAAAGKLIPHEQLQIIFVNNLGTSINGLDKTATRDQAKLLREHGRRLLDNIDDQAAAKVVFAEDVALPVINDIAPFVADMLQAKPDLFARIQQKSLKHGSDFVTYVAAHVVHQETALLTPVPLTASEPNSVSAERIVSIGCQQEHLFYDLRQQARRTLTDLDYLPTTQLFTRHVLPPYYMARGCEQTLQDAVAGRIDMSQMTDSSARRDVEQLLSIMPGQGNEL